MQELLVFALVFLVGAFVAWFIAGKFHAATAGAPAREAEVRLEEARREMAAHQTVSAQERARADALQEKMAAQLAAWQADQARLEGARSQLEVQKAAFEEDRAKLVQEFKALSGDALKQNNEQFLQLAKSQFETSAKQAEGELGKREEAIKALVAPITEKLGTVEKTVQAINDARTKEYIGLDKHIDTLSKSHVALQRETTSLANSLRNPTNRGRWGELTLKRVTEQAGMSEHCTTEQSSQDTEGGRQRPDMLVNLPGGRVIVVDAKAPLNAYLDATNAVDDAARKVDLARHGKALRNHVNALAQKAYWTQFERTPEFVILFVPGEAFLSAALEADGELLEYALMRRVVLASPANLVAMLRTIELCWREEKLQVNAKAIADLGGQLHERIGTMAGHFDKLGKSLGRAVGSFNDAIGSLEGRVMVSARKLRDLGATGAEALEETTSVDVQPRQLTMAREDVGVDA